MKKTITILILGMVLLIAFSLQAQTMNYKTGYQFPTEAQDSVLCGLRSVRGVDYHPDPIGNGVAAFTATNYTGHGFFHVFKAAGDDSLELVYTSPPMDSAYGSTSPRFAKWGDMDNDGNIEIIVAMDKNGIFIFEWDGVADSWNFGTEPARVIADNNTYPVDSVGTYARTEYLEVNDFDNDGQNELIFAVNAKNYLFDRYYIFSIDGEYSPGDPGFSSINREAMYAKSAGPFAVYGGGSPYAMIGANLDGIGNPEIIIHPWNYGNVTPLRVTGENTYELADTTGGNHYYYSTHPTDAVSLGGGTAFDIDKDGREEIYIPLYSAGTGTILMIHYEEGDDLSKIDSSNVFKLDVSSVYSSGSLYGRAGYGDYDSDGKPNLYFAGRQKEYIVSSEFDATMGDKTDPASWTHEIIYTGLELDSKIFVKIEITDSAGVIDTVKTLQSEDEGTMTIKLFGMFTDFDKDGYEDIIMPTQTWLDSVDNLKYIWLNDTAYTVYDTSYAGTDSMKIDTIDYAYSIYDTTSYKTIEPNRISIRMLESSVPNGIRAKDLTIITPDKYVLEQNYPNPFNPTTSIEFYLPINKKISLTIYNALGQKVKTLINNEMIKRGSHLKEWDSTNSAGVKVASGMYIYELKFGNFTLSKRMMLLK